MGLYNKAQNHRCTKLFYDRIFVTNYTDDILLYDSRKVKGTLNSYKIVLILCIIVRDSIDGRETFFFEGTKNNN